MKTRLLTLAVLGVLAGCQLHYEPGERPFAKVVEYPNFVLPQHGAWTVVGVKSGDTIVVERALPMGDGPLWEEERLRRAAGIPRFKPAGAGRYEVRIFGLRIPNVSDRYSHTSGDRAACEFLVSFVKGRRVALLPSPSWGTAYVYVLDTSLDDGATVKTSTQVNLELLLRGLAMVDPVQFRDAGGWHGTQTRRKFKRAEEEARSKALGLWRFGS